MTNFYFFLAIVPSIVLHEVAHGYVAYHFGDPTAKESHRLTLNPLRHVDLFGTILLPALLIISGLPAFGYAKPVPVNLNRLRKPRSQSLYVALAGPAVNIVLCALSFALCKISLNGPYYRWGVSPFLVNVGVYLGLVNLTLAVFNLIPIPPLDGSAIIERFIPRRHLPRYYQMRARALPVVMVLVFLDLAIFHFGTGGLTDLQNWWLNRLV